MKLTAEMMFWDKCGAIATAQSLLPMPPEVRRAGCPGVPCPPFVSLAGSPPDLLLHTTEQQHCTTHVGQKACCQNIHNSHWQSSVLITWPTPSFSGPPTQQARSHANQFNMSQEWAGSVFKKIQYMCDSILPHSQLWA